jgi:hypothetical protein
VEKKMRHAELTEAVIDSRRRGEAGIADTPDPLVLDARHPNTEMQGHFMNEQARSDGKLPIDVRGSNKFSLFFEP